MPSAVATRYARALVDVVLSPAAPVEPRRVSQELQSFAAMLGESRELCNVLLTPSIAVGRKRAVVDRLAASLGCSKISRNFLLVLVRHRRVAELAAILEAYDLLADERLGVLRVDLASARELSAAQRGVLEAGLAEATGKQITLTVSTDAALIGGLLARVGSTVYDGSLRGRIEALGRRLGAG